MAAVHAGNVWKILPPRPGAIPYSTLAGDAIGDGRQPRSENR